MRGQALVTETLRLEETRFRETLERGLGLLAEETGKLPDAADLPGDVAFRLYDTYGFPLDLTEDALRRQGRGVDRAGFEARMTEQRARARAAWSGSGDAATERLWFDLRERLGATEFLGYAATEARGRIVALIRDGAEVGSANEGDDVSVVANQTPFYGEAGGQMGDTGAVETAGGARIEIADTLRKLGDLHVHVGRVVAGEIGVGDDAALAVDAGRRDRLRANHSATHLLHEALRRRLGAHVTQKGSLVAPDRLRFDISHPSAVDDDDLAAVEAEVNAAIRANGEVVTRLMTPDEAIEAGALALFGEKYGEEVRVVSMGASVSGEEGGKDRYSTELCGGTHVRRTGDIGVFRIVSEGAVASGVRRIEALTGEAALAYLDEQDRRVRSLAGRLRTPPADLEGRVASLVDERGKLEREVADLRRKIADGPDVSPGGEVREIAGVKVVARTLDGVPAKDLRGMADRIKRRIGSGVVVLVATGEGKAAIVAGVTDDLTDRYNAIDLVRAGVAELGGKGGGGRPDMAQGGGPGAAAAEAAIAAVERRIAG